MRDDPSPMLGAASVPAADGAGSRATLGGHHSASVHLLVADDGLRKALESLVNAAGDFELGSRSDWPERGELVIATTGDLPADRARVFVTGGVHVVVLAAVPRVRERARYDAAGVAAYLPMNADGHRLIDELRAIPLHPAREARTSTC